MPKKEEKKEKNHIDHPILSQTLTIGEKSSDILTKWMGSWMFIILFLIFLILWISTNVYAWIHQWDPYPFIFLNLFLSMLAAIQAPIILMSQNREMQKEKIKAKYNYAVNRKAEREIEKLKTQLDRIERKLTKS